MKPTHADPNSTNRKIERREPGKRRTADAHDKPDAEVVADVKEAEVHVEAHEAEQGSDDVESGAHPDDARKGYSQDSGYAQSGGQRPQHTSRR